MTKLEYLNELRAELNKNDVADAEDIVSEFKQHFLFAGAGQEELLFKFGIGVCGSNIAQLFLVQDVFLLDAVFVFVK